MSVNNRKLLELRTSIDSIDDQIVDLLKQRMDLVHQVGEFKKETGIKGCFLKPGREATIIRELVAKLTPSYPEIAIANIWRMIIASSLNQEQRLSVYVLSNGDEASYWVAREYFGNFIPISRSQTIGSVLADVEKHQSAIGVFPFWGNDSLQYQWWQSLQQDIKVFALIPFIETGNKSDSRYIAVGKVAPEPTGNDSTLFYISTNVETTKSIFSNAFEEVGLDIVWLETSPTPGDDNGRDYLLRVSEFLDDEDSRFKKIKEQVEAKTSHFSIIGSYANPIILDNE